MTTELSSTTITNILEAVPGIKTVLRSPAADAMVNLTRAAAGIAAFDLKDARELMRFAFRRGLINNDEHDHVLADVEGAAAARQVRLAARKAARDDKVRKVRRKPKTAKPRAARPKAKHAKPKAKVTRPRGKAARPRRRAAPKKRPAPKKPKLTKKPRPKAAKAKKRR